MTSWKDRDRFGMRARPTHKPKAPPPPPPPPPTVGARVVRGPDWVGMWGDHDGGAPGTVAGITADGDGAWVLVKWDAGGQYTYRWNVQGKFDLALVPAPVPAEAAVEPRITSITLEETAVPAEHPAEPPKARPSRLLPGTRVGRGPDWKWGDQDGDGAGTVISAKEANPHDAAGNDEDDLWVYVRWDASEEVNAYRWGFEDAFDLTPVTTPTASTEPAPAESAEPAEAGAVCEVSTHQEHFSFSPAPAPAKEREAKLRDLTQQLSHVFDAFDIAKERGAEPFVLAAHYKVAVKEIESLNLKLAATLDAEELAEVP